MKAMANWNLFLGAAILGGGLSVKVGAPLEAVLGGVALAALATWMLSRARRVSPSVGSVGK